MQVYYLDRLANVHQEIRIYRQALESNGCLANTANLNLEQESYAKIERKEVCQGKTVDC